ncbi:hypothetical protein C0991_008207 [Blastosporella zonata]|nr:hypothetical protein C0991_008207 [Blastosporella zonata]
MSRLTAAQVIALGEYLEPTFDPASLTVSQLLGVLGYHHVKYPTPYSKPKLAIIFNEEIKAKAVKLKKERVKKESSIASDDGIVDGATGQPLRKEQVTRRGSRRLSHAPIEADTEEVPAPPNQVGLVCTRADQHSTSSQAKRRRSSAQPDLGGSSRKTVRAQPALVEESEPEEDLPMKKVGRSRKTAADDSGWEDNNIFQSGAESSSPARPSPVRSKKNAPRTTKSRKSTSAPPQMLLSSPPRLPRSPDDKGFSPLSPPQSTFEPHLPAIPSLDQLRLSQPQFTTFTPSRLRTPVPKPQPEESDDELDIIGTGANQPESDELPLEQEDAEVNKEEVDSPMGPGGRLIPDQEHSFEQQDPLGAKVGLSIFRLLTFFMGIYVLYALVTYTLESASIGYCDAGHNTNNALDRLREERLAVEACKREKIVDLDSTRCPIPPMIPWVPNSCTPCPDHAKCIESSVFCDYGFILRSHPLLFFLPASSSPRKSDVSLASPPSDLMWKLVTLLDGFPGFGSVAFPPRCIEDPKRKRNIGVLGKAVESLLGQERGRRVCAGGKVLKESVEEVDGGDAKQWGLELENLRKMMKKKTPPHLLPTFDDTFNEAIQQLTQWGEVIIGEDRENHRYVAHKTPFLTWDCVITIKTREIWAEWRNTVFGNGAGVAILALLYWRTRSSQKRAENKHVADLVQIALDTLRNQELAHHTDPVTTPQPYLSSLQLRDSILQEEHSVASRSRLWDQVERIVEGNANVRANLQEIQGGDEMRVWRWVGSAGRGAVAPR